ncbi:MAG: hypothetical protein JWM46_343 [Candidatus Kaiserbacteria bacterium]|nr:hypothetical protein [Candidatus Kaiserbacteria bacterium]
MAHARICVVEEDKEMREALYKALTDAGCRVDVYESHRAVTAMMPHIPDWDTIVTHLGRDGSGAQMVSLIRQLPGHELIRAISFTSHSSCSFEKVTGIDAGDSTTEDLKYLSKDEEIANVVDIVCER